MILPPMSADTIGTDFKFGQDDHNGGIRMLAIWFFNFMRGKMDILYLFVIENSHGRIVEQVRGDIENWL